MENQRKVIDKGYYYLGCFKGTSKKTNKVYTRLDLEEVTRFNDGTEMYNIMSTFIPATQVVPEIARFSRVEPVMWQKSLNEVVLMNIKLYK